MIVLRYVIDSFLMICLQFFFQLSMQRQGEQGQQICRHQCNQRYVPRKTSRACWRTKVGLEMRGVLENDHASQLLGYQETRYKMLIILDAYRAVFSTK
mmetsp:Transcript_5546/g.8039  ORF Transcript_5546/g.8039 Transcript_5546/m.8039 type:complete len:98 (+) Transcript_5546:354-647(+)